jgi:hypothetical protein
MENNNKADIDRWVAERLATLMPDSEFRPNSIWALARFRTLRDVRSRHGRLCGWMAAVVSVTLLCLFALPAPRAVAQRFLNFGYAALRQSAPTPDHPEYAGTRLVRPVAYREWIYLSSGLGMEYTAAVGGPENFTNVFVPQWAYREFLATGKWPDKSMFVLEGRASQTKGSINKSGHFQTDLTSLAVEVKDETRYANKWAYFGFRSDAKTAEAMTGPTDQCWVCHNGNAAVEHTFVQFYPTLKPVALKFGTYRAQAE